MVIMDEADGIMNFINYGVPISGSGPSNPRSMKNSFTLKVIHQYSLGPMSSLGKFFCISCSKNKTNKQNMYFAV